MDHLVRKDFWQYVKEWHDKRISQIFGTKPNGKRVTSDAGVRTYDVSTNGYDVEFKSDNFSNGPRSQSELTHMQSQIDKDIYNSEQGLATPYWHFDHDPSNAEEMKPLLKLLSDAKIPWTFGSENSFSK